MGDLGLIPDMKAYAPYALDPQRKHQTVAAEVIADLASKTIDAAVLWGPAAGWLAKQSGTAMVVTPLLKEPERPPMAYRIAMGVRIGENDWKRSLNTILRRSGEFRNPRRYCEQSEAIEGSGTFGGGMLP